MAHIYKRGKTWAVRFSKREKVWDPKQQKEISRLSQKQKGGFKTKAEATAYGAQMEVNSQKGIDVINNPTYADLFHKWYITFKKPTARYSTLRLYEHADKLVHRIWGTTRVKDISRVNYQNFINKYSETHSTSTVQGIHSKLSSCFKYAVDEGIILRDPSRNANIHGNDNHKRKTQYLSLKEIKKLEKYCLNTRFFQGNPSPSRYIILLLIHSGMRVGEALALTWQDIDFQNNTVSITKTYNRRTKAVTAPKTQSSNRRIKVDSFILNLLKELKSENSEYIFSFHKNQPLNYNLLVIQFKLYMERVGITKKNYTLHSLRHSHVAILISKGVSIYAISKRLGHAKISTTLDVYSYLIDEFKQQQDNQITDIFENLIDK